MKKPVSLEGGGERPLSDVVYVHQAAAFSVWGLGFRVQGLGFRV